MITEENCIIDRSAVRAWIDTDMLSNYSIMHSMKKIIMMLIDDPEDAQNALMDCVAKNEMALQKRNERNSKQNLAVTLEDERLERMK